MPAARILTVPQAVELDQLAHRRFFTEVPFPGEASNGRPVRLSGTGVLVDGQPQHPSGAAPLLGEHNGELSAIVRRWRAAGRAGAEVADSVGPPCCTN